MYSGFHFKVSKTVEAICSTNFSDTVQQTWLETVKHSKKSSDLYAGCNDEDNGFIHQQCSLGIGQAKQEYSKSCKCSSVSGKICIFQNTEIKPGELCKE